MPDSTIKMSFQGVPHEEDCDCLECRVKLIPRRLRARPVFSTPIKQKTRQLGLYTMYHADLSVNECIDQLHQRATGEKVGNLGQKLITSILYYLKNPGEISCKKEPKS